jgi:hypothetical protein
MAVARGGSYDPSYSEALAHNDCSTTSRTPSHIAKGKVMEQGVGVGRELNETIEVSAYN